MREEFARLLFLTNRPEVPTIIDNLTKLGFFEAPASTRFHLCCPGGLVQHCVSVCNTALQLREMIIKNNPELESKLPFESVIFVSLLHDVCKAEIYKPAFRNVKNNETGQWEKVQSYEVDYDYFPAGHGEKSVIRLMKWGVDLSMDEILAIRWHMNAWELPMQSNEAKGNISAAANKCPLVTLLQTADMLSSAIFEPK